jgi:hypothetical protein
MIKGTLILRTYSHAAIDTYVKNPVFNEFKKSKYSQAAWIKSTIPSMAASAAGFAGIMFFLNFDDGANTLE